MPIDTSDEILQDFLVEAGELLEQLGEQLVELEQRPRDKELLNAVFRNFHTVKGGAGFLALDALVEICHRAEDVFNILRQGERVVDAKLMDVVLRSLDIVNNMIEGVRNAVDPEPADREVIAALERFARPEVAEAEVVVPETAPTDVAGAQFDQMLSAAGATPVSTAPSKPVAPQAPVAKASPSVNIGGGENITDDEFEALLDQVQGKRSTQPPKPEAPATKAVSPTPPVTGSDEISDGEFEEILNQVQGSPAKTMPQVTAPQKSEKQQVAASTPPVAAKNSAPTNNATVTAKAPVKKEEPTKTEKAAPQAEGTQTANQAETTVRVDTKRLDDIMNLVGELVLVRNRLATLRAQMGDEVAKAVSNLDLVTADLQNSVMKTRMQPIKKVFGRFPRVVRDLARSLNKQVSLELYGEETDLDKNLVEALADPLVHLVRNAVDHGIEMPDERVASGKSAMGTVKLSAEQEGDHILLRIEDDGAGMDPEVLRRKAVEKGVMDEDAAARLDEHQAFNLIFAPGFSTKAEISDISGRGVGMDVVKTRITQLNGTIEIDSKKGRGSRISIKVPLTLAIMPTLMVQLDEQIFALPLANVIEIFDHETARTSTVDGKRVVVVRDKAIPLVFLENWLVRRRRGAVAAPKSGYVVVVSYGSQHVGCVVEQLIGQEEVVIKPLGSMLSGTSGLAGATITGNGRIALILDMPGLMEAYGRRA